MSSKISRPGEKAAICRASSAPIVPPAPVTRTRRPRISRAIAVAVEHRLRAAEQILERDRFEGALGIVEVALEIGEPRQPRERDRQRVGAVEQPPDLLAGQVLRGDDQLLRALAAPIEPRDHGFERIDRAEDRHP